MSVGHGRATSVVVVTLLVGCGSSNGHAVDGGGGATGTTPDAGAGATAGVVGAGGSGGGAAGATGGAAGAIDGGPVDDATAVDPFADLVNGAAIAVASVPYELQGLDVGMVVLDRLPAAPGAMDSTCTSVRTGDCVISHCTGYNPNLVRLSAGFIHVDSPDAGIHVTAGGGSYSGPKAFGGGEDVTISTSGGDVPAFSVAMHVPLMLLVEQPTMPTLYPMNLAVAAPHTAPLTLTWQRGAPGVFLVALAGNVQGFGLYGDDNVICFFDSRTGTGTVPAAALSEMIPGQVFVLLTANAAMVDAGSQRLKVWLLEEALTPDKKADVVLGVQ